jgi:hypothetical protein
MKYFVSYHYTGRSEPSRLSTHYPVYTGIASTVIELDDTVHSEECIEGLEFLTAQHAKASQGFSAATTNIIFFQLL